MKPALVLLALALLAGCSQNAANPPPAPAPLNPTNTPVPSASLTLPEAIERAKTALRERGYSHIDKPLRVEADEANTAWKKRLEQVPALRDDPRVRSFNLREQKYWAIYFAPQPPPGHVIKGGDAWVFIHRDDGGVIGVMLGR